MPWAGVDIQLISGLLVGDIKLVLYLRRIYPCSFVIDLYVIYIINYINSFQKIEVIQSSKLHHLKVCRIKSFSFDPN